jgi:hypothetical protein
MTHRTLLRIERDIGLTGLRPSDARAEHAARLVGFIDERFRVLSYEREYTERWCLEKIMAAIRERLTQPEIDRLAAEGASWPEDRAIELAMTL